MYKQKQTNMTSARLFTENENLAKLADEFPKRVTTEAWGRHTGVCVKMHRMDGKFDDKIRMRLLRAGRS